MNLNETPLQRFQQSQFFEKHSEYIASQAFVEACKETLLALVQDMPAFTLAAQTEQYANNYQQIMGAMRALTIMRSLGIKKEIEKLRPTDGLNYAAK